jgi:hypothetical protein
MLRITFGPKSGKVAESWRRLQNVELRNLCSSSDQSKGNDTGRACRMHGKVEKCMKYFG